VRRGRRVPTSWSRAGVRIRAAPDLTSPAATAV